MQRILESTFGLARTARPRPARHGGAGLRARRVLLVTLVVPVVGFAGTTARAAATPRVTPREALASPAPGKWTEIGTTNWGGPAAMWRAPDNRDWVMWAPNSTSYDLALLAPDGGIAVGR